MNDTFNKDAADGIIDLIDNTPVIYTSGNDVYLSNSITAEMIFQGNGLRGEMVHFQPKSNGRSYDIISDNIHVDVSRFSKPESRRIISALQAKKAEFEIDEAIRDAQRADAKQCASLGRLLAWGKS